MGEKTYSSKRWLILVLTFLACGMPYYIEYQVSPLAPKLMAMLHLSTSQFSSIFTAPLISSIFFSIVAGMLVDKYGVKIVVGVSLVISVIGTALRPTADAYGTMLFYTFLVGFGATFANTSAAKIVAAWFPSQQIGPMVGLVVAGSSVLMGAGLATTAIFPSVNSAFNFGTMLMVIVVVLWFLLFTENSKRNGEMVEVSSVPMGESLKHSVKSPGVWLCALCLMCIFGGAITLSALLPTALIGRGINPAAAGGYTSFIMLGSIIGCILSPIPAAKLGNKAAVFLCALVAAIGIAFGWLVPAGLPLTIVMIIVGVTYGASIPVLVSIPIQLKEIGPAYAGTAGGILGTLQMFGAVVIPSYVLAVIAGSNMHLLFLLAGIVMAVTCVLALFLPKLGAHEAYEEKKSAVVAE
jgi:nitrate/nitrite transporter NarK